MIDGNDIDKPPKSVNEIILAKKPVTPETALRIAAAMDTSAELWINLEADYGLSLARRQMPNQLLLEIAARGAQALS